jgi:basic membrane protein A
MSTKSNLLLSVILTVTMLLVACAPAAPTTATAAPTTEALQPTTVPATSTVVPTIAALVQPTATLLAAISAPADTPIVTAMVSNDTALKIGLVTDTGGISDQGFNQLAWEGIQKAVIEMGFEPKFIESTQPTDYEANIDTLAGEGYDVIITIGASMGDVTALKAKQYPDIKFGIVDHAYSPTSGSQVCADTVSNCYTDGGLTNVTSLMFAEQQIGFLAGVLAGGMSQSDFVCSISSVPPPASDRYVISFRAGATWQAGENLRGMNNYINIETTNENMPNVIDPTGGKDTAQVLIDSGCDVIFGIAADGALLAAQENNLMAIGSDVDQYNTYPEAKNALMSSTQKKVDVAVYNYLKSVDDESVLAGISTSNLQNGGVGLVGVEVENKAMILGLHSIIERSKSYFFQRKASDCSLSTYFFFQFWRVVINLLRYVVGQVKLFIVDNTM